MVASATVSTFTIFVIGVLPITSSKSDRNVAKGIEFERLPKYDNILLEIKDGKIGPSCNNRTMYTTRVAWIVKHYAEIRHVRWSIVDEKEKNVVIEYVGVWLFSFND